MFTEQILGQGQKNKKSYKAMQKADQHSEIPSLFHSTLQSFCSKRENLKFQGKWT